MGRCPFLWISPAYKLMATQLCLVLEAWKWLFLLLSPPILHPFFASATGIFAELSALWGQPGSKTLLCGLLLGLLTGSSKKSPRKTFLRL